MAKEGETYLDQLLNTVAPDWEDTSKQPEKNMEGAENVMSDENTTTEDGALQEAMDILNSLPDMDDSEPGDADADLADAMAILGDLPDMDGEAQGDLGEDMDELFDLLSDTLPETGEEEAADTSFSGEEQEMEMPEEPEMTPAQEESEEPEMTPAEEESEEPEMTPAQEESEEPEMMSVEEGTEEPDVTVSGDGSSEPEEPAEETPISIDSLPEEPDVRAESDASEETPVSESSVAVDDIFQDALSAVGYSESEETGEEQDDIFSIGDMADLMDDSEEGVSSVPIAEPAIDGNLSAKKKKPGFFKRIFGNIITDTTAEEEERARQAEERLKEKKAAQKAEKKKQAEATKEEKAQLAQEEKERKKQQKAELAVKKAEKKEEKKRLRAEQNAEAAKEVEGKINPIGATIVAIFFVTIGVATLFGSRLLERRSALNDAENYFANEEYILAYNSISSVNLREDDERLYRRIRICSQMQKELNSYENYNSMSMRLEALDSLIKGVRYYDVNRSEAQSLGIEMAYDKLSRQITEKLAGEFGLGEDEARTLLTIEDQGEYTMRLQQITGSN